MNEDGCEVEEDKEKEIEGDWALLEFGIVCILDIT